MSITLNIVDKSPPAGVAWHGSPAELLQWIVQYMEIRGMEGFTAVNVGVDTPSADDRDKPWFRLDSNGALMGWYGWNGTEWKKSPTVKRRGTTAERPTNPTEGMTYFDTTISASLIFERNKWRVDDGRPPGAIIMHDSETVQEALDMNPGYAYFSAMASRSPMGAGTGEGLTERKAQKNLGTETHKLTEDEMPAHTHGVSIPYSNTSGNYDLPSNDKKLPEEENYGIETGSTGNGVPHPNIHPCYTLWFLRKE